MVDTDVSRSSTAEKPKKSFLPVLIGVIVIVIVVGAFGIWYLSQSQAGEHELLLGRATIVLTEHTDEGDVNSTNVIEQENVAGKYAVGSDLFISWPFFNEIGTGTLTLVSVEPQTSGFTFKSSNPALPVTAPNSGTRTVDLTFSTPNTPYRGAFDYTVYLDYTP